MKQLMVEFHTGQGTPCDIEWIEDLVARPIIFSIDPGWSPQKVVKRIRESDPQNGRNIQVKEL